MPVYHPVHPGTDITWLEDCPSSEIRQARISITAIV